MAQIAGYLVLSVQGFCHNMKRHRKDIFFGIRISRSLVTTIAITVGRNDHFHPNSTLGLARKVGIVHVSVCLAKNYLQPLLWQEGFYHESLLLKTTLAQWQDLFKLQPGEAIGVYSALFLRNLIACRTDLDTVITVIRRLRPIVMVVTETEAYLDSPAFMDRFIEALLFYGASFDSLEACMDRSNPNRITLEAEYFRWGIQNVLTFEEEERSTWYMKIDGWRDFFKSHGLEDRELSMSSLYQANLVVNNSASGSSCTLDMDGKCLLVGWKGTPIFSLSAWNFLP